MGTMSAKKKMMIGACAIASFAFAGVVYAGSQVADNSIYNLNASSVTRSISYAYGVNQTTMGSQVETTTGITNSGSGTRVLTKNSYTGKSFSYSDSPYYCVVSSKVTTSGTTSSTQATLKIQASIQNITSVRAIFKVSSDIVGNYVYRPKVVFYSGNNFDGTTSPNEYFLSDTNTTNDGVEHDATLNISDLNLGFTPKSFLTNFAFYSFNASGTATVYLKSLTVTWTC
jgi:hypothetical protein